MRPRVGGNLENIFSTSPFASNTAQQQRDFIAFGEAAGQRAGSNLGDDFPRIPPPPRPAPANLDRVSGHTSASRAAQEPRGFVTLTEARERAYQKLKEKSPELPPPTRSSPAHPAQESEKRYTLPKLGPKQTNPHTRAEPSSFCLSRPFPSSTYVLEFPRSSYHAGASSGSSPQKSGAQPMPLQKTAVCPFLQMLPPKVRLLIYKELLCTPMIIRAGELVENKRTALVFSDERPLATNLDIHATFLRTCRKIYNEALPILYQENSFSFEEARMLRPFRSKNLKKTSAYTPSPVFAFQDEEQGRLSFLKSLHIRFTHDSQIFDVREWQPSRRKREDFHGELEEAKVTPNITIDQAG